MPIGFRDRGDIRRINRSVLETEGRRRGSIERRRARTAPGATAGGIATTTTINRHRGYLSADLAPSTGCGANPTTAVAVEWASVGGVWSPTGSTHIITNRDDNVAIGDGAYIHYKLYGDEFAIDYFNYAECEAAPANCSCDDLLGNPGSDSPAPCSWVLNTPHNYGGLFAAGPLDLCFAPLSGGTQGCGWYSEWSAGVAITFPGFGSATAYVRYELGMSHSQSFGGPIPLTLDLKGVWREDPADEFTTHIFGLKNWTGSIVPNSGNLPDVGQTASLPARAGTGANFDWVDNPSCTINLGANPAHRTPYEVAALEGIGCAGSFSLQWSAAGSVWQVIGSTCDPSTVLCCPVPWPFRSGSVDAEQVGPFSCMPANAGFVTAITVEVGSVATALAPCQAGDRPPYPAGP